MVLIERFDRFRENHVRTSFNTGNCALNSTSIPSTAMHQYAP
jgi:hypothetical protein